MKKRSKVLLFALLALIAASGLILTGCSNGSTETVYADVRLTPGSHGFANGGTVIGLATGSQYVVRSGNSWSATKADGSLADAKPTPGEALLADAVAVLNTGITTITGLSKGTSYTVYLVGEASGNNSLAFTATLTGGRNLLVDASAIATDTYTITIAAGTSTVGGSVVVLLA